MWHDDYYQSRAWVDLVTHFTEHPEDDRLIMADWLMDHDMDFVKASEVVEPPILSQYLSTDYYGSGSGSGNGRGRGSGSGSGSGSGIGSGRGSGRGRGRGIGSGIGRGIIMEIGKAYLVITVDWFAWVGRVVRQVGPFEFEFESLSKISETNNGDCWQALCDGDKAARQRATYQHYSVKGLLGIGAVIKLEWRGKTPQEEAES